MHRVFFFPFILCLCSVSCQSEHPPARFSLPLGKWCVAQSQRVDSSFAVAQATDAIAGHYLSAGYKPVRIEQARDGMLISLVPERPQGTRGGGLIWVDGETGCAMVLKRYE